MVALDNILREVYPYAHLYKSMCQVFGEEQQKAVSENREQLAVSMIIHNDKHKIQDQRRFNNPTTNEIDSVLFFVLEEITFRCFILEPFQMSHWYILGFDRDENSNPGTFLKMIVFGNK